MSYAVRHRVEWDNEAVSRERMNRDIAREMGMGLSMEETENIILGAERYDWRERERHLAAVSRQHPGTLITTDCEGEDGERWVEYYRDGMNYDEGYDPPGFDESKLA